MNNITIVGRLTRDPEYTEAKGEKVQRAKFTVAVDNDYGDGASFFDCIVFGKIADTIDKYLCKGRLVSVKGRIEQGETWTDKNGSQRRSWTLYPSFDRGVEFLGGAADSKAKVKPSEAPANMPDSFEEAESDIPF